MMRNFRREHNAESIDIYARQKEIRFQAVEFRGVLPCERKACAAGLRRGRNPDREQDKQCGAYWFRRGGLPFRGHRRDAGYSRQLHRGEVQNVPSGVRMVLRGRDEKKRANSGNGGNGGKIRDVYAALYLERGIMPDTVARQDPKILFDMMDTIDGMKERKKPSKQNYSSPYIRAVFG